MKPRYKRLAIVVAGLGAVGTAAALVLSALDSNIAFFYSHTQVQTGEAPKARTIRLGGLVKDGSVRRDQMTVSFVVTDTAHDVKVRYTGILPDLFKEGKGAVAQGRLDDDGTFVAREVLAKHDENYMPPEAKQAVDAAHRAARARQDQH